jgi:small neutral amino acid transporter SnatA (MarC family)
VARAIPSAAGIIDSFGVCGQALPATLGISATAFGAAGGMLLFLVAIAMHFGRPSGARETAREQAEDAAREATDILARVGARAGRPGH